MSKIGYIYYDVHTNTKYYFIASYRMQYKKKGRIPTIQYKK